MIDYSYAGKSATIGPDNVTVFDSDNKILSFQRGGSDLVNAAMAVAGGASDLASFKGGASTNWNPVEQNATAAQQGGQTSSFYNPSSENGVPASESNFALDSGVNPSGTTGFDSPSVAQQEVSGTGINPGSGAQSAQQAAATQDTAATMRADILANIQESQTARASSGFSQAWQQWNAADALDVAINQGPETTDADASTPVGRPGSWTDTSQTNGNTISASRELTIAGAEAGEPPVNSPTTIDGRYYSGHALDRMQQRGFTPSVIEDAISSGTPSLSYGGTTAYYSSKNNIIVIVNQSGRVITVRGGAP
jgi:hypothetical protein